MIITVQLPNGTATLGVAEDLLVFDGEQFVDPTNAAYLELFSIPVEALSSGFSSLAVTLSAAVRLRANVLGLDPTVVPVTDPSVVIAVDPSDGKCICGITCAGTNLRFVIVKPEN
jgi:hypothetical protein